MILVPLPLSSLPETKGCIKAPDAILKALDELWSSENGKVVSYKLKAYEEKTFKLSDRTIFLGGDHSISFKTVGRLAKKHNIGLVIFDAHADCMPGKLSHQSWLRKLIESGFNPSNIILVGSRNNDPIEQKFLLKHKVSLFPVDELEEDISSAAHAIMEATKKLDFYLSIDIDVVDPAFAPGTYYREPGGLSSRQLIYLVRKLALLKGFKAADIVEVNPELDINGLTAKLAAKLLVELL